MVSSEPIILESARKHGVADADIHHAFRNPLRVFVDEVTLVLGPDRAGNLLEVGWVEEESVAVVVHAMPARRRFRS